MEQVQAAGGGVAAARGLETARQAGIIDLAGQRVQFTHPLLASVLYSGASPGQRRRLHRRLAGVVTDPEERARHLALGAAGPDAQVAAVLDEAAAPGPGPRPQRAAPAAAPLAQPRLLLRDPRPRQLADQLAPVSSSEAVYTPAVLGAVAGLAQVLLIAAAVIVGVGAAGLVGLLVWQ